MNKEEIIEKLYRWEYKLEYKGDCDCSVEWWLDSNNILRHDFYCSKCWNAIYIIVNGERVASLDDSNKWRVFGDIEYDDIPPSIKYFAGKMLDEQIALETRYLLYDSLVKWLMQGNFMLSRRDGDSTHIYTMILTRVPQPIEITREEAEKWAEDYLMWDNTTCKYPIGLEVVG